MFQLGKSYKTKGGWRAQILGIDENSTGNFFYWVKHHYKDSYNQRLGNVFHDINGCAEMHGACLEFNGVRIPNPVDLTEEELGELEPTYIPNIDSLTTGEARVTSSEVIDD